MITNGYKKGLMNYLPIWNNETPVYNKKITEERQVVRRDPVETNPFDWKTRLPAERNPQLRQEQDLDRALESLLNQGSQPFDPIAPNKKKEYFEALKAQQREKERLQRLSEQERVVWKQGPEDDNLLPFQRQKQSQGDRLAKHRQDLKKQIQENERRSPVPFISKTQQTEISPRRAVANQTGISSIEVNLCLIELEKVKAEREAARSENLVIREMMLREKQKQLQEMIRGKQPIQLPHNLNPKVVHKGAMLANNASRKKWGPQVQQQLAINNSASALSPHEAKLQEPEEPYTKGHPDDRPIRPAAQIIQRVEYDHIIPTRAKQPDSTAKPVKKPPKNPLKQTESKKPAHVGNRPAGLEEARRLMKEQKTPQNNLTPDLLSFYTNYSDHLQFAGKFSKLAMSGHRQPPSRGKAKDEISDSIKSALDDFINSGK